MGSPQLDFLVLSVAGVIFFCSTVDGIPTIPGVPFCSAIEDASPVYNWLKFKAVEAVIRYTGRNNNNYYVNGQFEKSSSYAHGTCFLSDIEHPNSCSECLRGAEAVILDTCGPFAVGARLNLVICHLRYENYVFTEG